MRSFACLLVSSTLLGQSPQWQLPEHGVAVYRQTSDLSGTPLHPFGSASNRCQPLVFADELVDNGRRWLAAPWSLETIPLWLAFDLTSVTGERALEHVWERIHDHGRVTFRGGIGNPDAQGWQRIEGRLTRADVRPRSASAPPRQLVLDRHYFAQDLDVRLTVRRRFTDGLVHEVQWSIDGRLTAGSDRRTIEVRGERAWQLEAVRGNRFPASDGRPGFHDVVRTARAECAARQLLALTRMEGALAGDEGAGSIHGPALHALSLYGLARAGRRIGDPLVEDALRQLLARPMRRAHVHALAVLATAGLHAGPTQQRGDPPAIDLPPDLQRSIAGHVTTIRERSLRARGEGGDRIWWAFDGDEAGSSTSSGICIRALDVAVRCGVTVPAELFAAHARHLLDRAVAVGPGRPSRTVDESHSAPTIGRDGRGTTMLYAWSEHGDRELTVNGEDTVWAMGSLLVCRRHVRATELKARIDAVANGAWSWLSTHFTARHAPGPFEAERQRRGGYVLALAWLLDETRTRWLDGRDVYFEQAMALLGDRDAGSVDTAVVDPVAALVFWRDEIDRGEPTTPGR